MPLWLRCSPASDRKKREMKKALFSVLQGHKKEGGNVLFFIGTHYPH